MKPSLLTTPRLARFRLVSTNCELPNPLAEPESLNLEMNHEVNFLPNDGGKVQTFSLATTTTIIGNDTDGTELLRMNCSFLAEYIFSDKSLQAKDFEPATEYFSNQIYLLIRAYVLNTLLDMGINGGVLPFSLKPGQLKNQSK